jgi:hypothetical protein
VLLQNRAQKYSRIGTSASKVSTSLPYLANSAYFRAKIEKMQLRKSTVGVLFMAMVLAVACSKFKQRDIVGKWEGALITQGEDTLKIDPKILKFSFDENKKYTFEGTLRHKEAGDYSVYNKYLFTTDRLAEKAEEKAVEILLLSADSLHLRMNDGGNERVLKLKRKK